MPRQKAKRINYISFTAAVVKRLLDTHSPDDMLAWWHEMDGDPHDRFFEELTTQLRERHPEEWKEQEAMKTEPSLRDLIPPRCPATSPVFGEQCALCEDHDGPHHNEKCTAIWGERANA